MILKSLKRDLINHFFKLSLLDSTIDETTLIRHGLNQFKEHIDLKLDIKEWKKQSTGNKTWKKFKSHFTKAIND